MQLRFEIPESFWSLFRSVNRETYIEALTAINEEYQYSNYFLTREVCIQVLRDLYMKKQIELKREEDETEFDMLETPSARILNWLIRKGWLKKIEDYNTLVTNIVIPDYAAIFVDAFERLSTEDLEETEIYIQNVYATLFSFKNDPRVNLNMLRTALINTRRLNKALQDMLHNMDKFFARLLEQQFYGDLLKEHLDGYVEEIVKKKYHIFKIICSAVSGIAAPFLWCCAGARGRGSVPAARVRCRVHRGRGAGLLPGKPAGLHHRGCYLWHPGHPAGLCCDLQTAERPLQGSGHRAFPAARALQCCHHRH